ncbi:MAG: hypothetical protein ACLF0G_04485 [Candidatus Brocadiia bacterium]
MNTRRRTARLLLAALGAALLAAGCSSSKDERYYRGPAFEVGKPPSQGWILVSKPRNFAFAAARGHVGLADTAEGKLVELTNPAARASAEIYLVDTTAADTQTVVTALLRQPPRRHLTEGPRRRVLVDGREGVGSIFAWRQSRNATTYYLYCVRVPLGTKLWCFVGTAPAEAFPRLRWDFKTVLRTVRFKAPALATAGVNGKG